MDSWFMQSARRGFRKIPEMRENRVGTPHAKGQPMNEKHHDSLKQYINDMIGLERDIANAVKLQTEDERLSTFGELKMVLDRVVSDSESRLVVLKRISEEEDGTFGAVVKEGITGTLAGIYGKMREHPVSRMVRDDIIALDVASVSYGMLLTLGLSIGHRECVVIAEQGLERTPKLIVELTDLLPVVVGAELAADAPLANPAAVQIAQTAIRDAWRNS
jgi:ferritin-like metal-binding protein YciE